MDSLGAFLLAVLFCLVILVVADVFLIHGLIMTLLGLVF